MSSTYAGYVRVSHVGGRSGESFHSPDDQVAVIREWARRHGHRVEILPAELNESGGRADRPILMRAVEGVETGRYVGVAVAYLSRLSRHAGHLRELWDRVEDAGGRMVAIAENLDTSTPSGRMQRGIIAAMAEHELDSHRDRFEGLREGSTAAGIWQRRQTPLGYAKDPQTRKLVPSPNADKVRKAFADRIGAKPISAIARDLGMTPSGVRALLRNRVYLGELKVGQHVNPTAHEAIVDEDTFDKVQYARVTRPPKHNEHPALLASLVRCAGCGHIMARTGLTYACAKHHSDGECPAPAGITARILNEYVTKIALVELDRLSVQGITTDNGAGAARSTLRAAENDLRNYLAATASAGLSVDLYAEGMRERQAIIDQRRDDLEEILSSQSLAFGGSYSGILTAWHAMHDGQRNRVLCGLLEAVVIRRSGRGRNVPVGERARVVRRGAGLFASYRGAGKALSTRAVFPDADDERLLRVQLAQDGLKLAGCGVQVAHGALRALSSEAVT